MRANLAFRVAIEEGTRLSLMKKISNCPKQKKDGKTCETSVEVLSKNWTIEG